MSEIIKHEGNNHMSDTDKVKADARKELIKDIADLSNDFAFCAGTSGLELAGAIVSYLAKNPDQIEPFLNRTDFLEFTQAYDVANGCLTFRSEDGKIRTPEELQIARAERQAKKETAQ